jgi:cytochrome c-type biogenesis protein CcmH/NrfF
LNTKNITIGIIFILIGVWLFISLSFLKVEQGSNPKRVIISEGILRSEEELAHALAEDINFDIKGAYEKGYTSRDVLDYLVKQPHKYSFAFYNNRYYEGRITVLYIIPLSVCLFLIVLGTAIIIRKKQKHKSI